MDAERECEYPPGEECGERGLNCCDCGGAGCGCPYCWSCNACDACLGVEDEDR